MEFNLELLDTTAGGDSERKESGGVDQGGQRRPEDAGLIRGEKEIGGHAEGGHERPPRDFADRDAGKKARDGNVVLHGGGKPRQEKSHGGPEQAKLRT